MNQPANTMRAVAIEKFGGLDRLGVKQLPIPNIESDEVLIRLELAGVGEWDAFEREGGFVAIGGSSRFPYVLGSEGAGTVVTIGPRVRHVQVGDRVYVSTFLNPKGGCYAQYVAVRGEVVQRIPRNLSVQQAAVMSGVALTALRGLDDTLHLQKGETVAIVGASGGIGHVAVQLAKRLGARVLAVASGPDGVALAKRIGADVVVDGRGGDVAAAAKQLAPKGLDAALLAAGGRIAETTLASLREGGRAAYPSGVEPAPRARAGITLHNYDGNPDADILQRVNALIEAGPFEVVVSAVFPLAQAADAQRALRRHHLGKIALHVP
ncbi:MAG: NADP-dependent oxidoreductase [Polyangiales bacterium]